MSGFQMESPWIRGSLTHSSPASAGIIIREEFVQTAATKNKKNVNAFVFPGMEREREKKKSF